MATVVRELVNVIGWKVNNSELKTAEAKTSKFLGKLKGIGLAVGAGILAIGASAIKVAGDMEALNAQFETMLGSAEAANDMMQGLIEFSTKTPFTPKQLAQSAKTLLNFGVTAEDIMPTLQRLGDVSGGNAEAMSGLTLAFGQMSSTGRLMGQDLLQMINAGFNPLTEISRTTGKSVAQLKDEMSKGAISAEMVAEAFRTVTAEGGKFNGNMERLSKTLPGLLSTLQGIVELSLAGAVTEVEDQIKGVVVSLIELFETTVRPLLSNLMKSLAPLFETLVSLLKPVFELLTPLFGILSTVLTNLSQVINNALMPLLNFLLATFTPILEDINIIFEEIMKIVSPLLEILLKNFSILLKRNIAPLLIQLKFILAILGPILKLINAILQPLLFVLNAVLGVINDLIDRATMFFFEIIDKGVEKVKEKFAGLEDVFRNIFNNVRDFFIKIINMSVDGINLLIDQANKIPGVKIDAIDKIDPEKLFKLERDKNQISNSVTTNIDARGSKDPQATKRAVREALSSPFQLEILRVIEGLG